MTDWDKLQHVTVNDVLLVFGPVVLSDDGCWEITTHKTSENYGSASFSGQPVRANRIMYFATTGIAPVGMCVLHHCDNPPCVRPEHLYLGTDADNSRDRVMRGRTAKGAQHGSRTHPERLARGDANGSRLHPERLMRGDDNHSRSHPESRPRGDANGSRLHPESRPRGDQVVVNAMKRTCECGKVTNPGGMRMHTKATGHTAGFPSSRSANHFDLTAGSTSGRNMGR